MTLEVGAHYRFRHFPDCWHRYVFDGERLVNQTISGYDWRIDADGHILYENGRRYGDLRDLEPWEDHP